LSRESALPGLDGGWVRTAVPVRLAADFTVPKPAIKFILPLTGALPSATAPKDVESTTGSALVVLQGPWYSIGGLAEDLQYEIVQPAATSDAGGYTIEAGPDPIVWHGTSSTDTPPNTYDAHQGTMSADDCLHGPVGHTFDTSDANSLFVNTSFVLDPPKPTGKSPMPWTFAEVRFKRVIANVPNVPAPGLQSEWTLPQWVQFLPGQFHGLLDGSAKAVDTSSYRVSTGAGTVSIVDGAGKPVSLYNVQTDNHLTFVLLLTRKVSDMLGRKGQERFLDVCVALSNPFDKNGKTQATWARGAVNGATDPDLVGRIMAIQLSPDASANQKVKDANPPQTAATPPPNFPPQSRDDLWAALFPASGDAFDAFARIVTISPPISSTSLPCANGGGQ
jgi:hypothetical protein